MNYEDFYQESLVLEKSIKESLLNAQKNFKNIAKNSENGDLKSMSKDITQIRGTINDLNQITSKLQELTEGFDAGEYITSGDFAKQMLNYCEELSLDIKGDFPSYEIFPYNLKIDAESQDLYVNRKKLQCLRPLSFVRKMKQNVEKYTKAPFNVNVFLNELAAAYDNAVLKRAVKNNNIIAEYDLSLFDLYDYLAPTQRARREYDHQNYAYDLSRLYASEITNTKDERKFAFGTSKTTKKLIRILDQYGKEQLLGTIRFYKAL